MVAILSARTFRARCSSASSTNRKNRKWRATPAKGRITREPTRYLRAEPHSRSHQTKFVWAVLFGHSSVLPGPSGRTVAGSKRTTSDRTSYWSVI